MCAVAVNQQATMVRPIAETDLHNLLRMVDTARRVHMRVASASLQTKIKTAPGFLAEDNVGLRGFMLTEPHSTTALIIAAGLRDTWGVRPYLASLLPEIERAVHAKGLSTLAHIGYQDWLIDGLQE